MDDLLELAVDGHGGLRRWERISRFRTRISMTGALWTRSGRPGLLDDVVLEGDTRDQRLTIAPFPRPGQHATWEPHRQRIETTDGVLVAERGAAAAFTTETRPVPWDEFQVAYFASEVGWNHFVAPFLFARADFLTEETWPWRENGQTWRTLLVTSPDTIVSHTRQQTCYFDTTGLLRRLDCTVDLLGGGPAVHYPSRYREVEGIMIPTRRRIYARTSDGSPARDPVLVAIDITEVALS